jgi:hypothetical protein
MDCIGESLDVVGKPSVPVRTYCGGLITNSRIRRQQLTLLFGGTFQTEPAKSGLLLPAPKYFSF